MKTELKPLNLSVTPDGRLVHETLRSANFGQTLETVMLARAATKVPIHFTFRGHELVAGLEDDERTVTARFHDLIDQRRARKAESYRQIRYEVNSTAVKVSSFNLNRFLSWVTQYLFCVHDNGYDGLFMPPEALLIELAVRGFTEEVRPVSAALGSLSDDDIYRVHVDVHMGSLIALLKTRAIPTSRFISGVANLVKPGQVFLGEVA